MACLPPSLRKGQKYRMDLRSSQQSCEVGESAITIPIFPLRTPKTLRHWDVSDPTVMKDMQTGDLRSKSAHLFSFECGKYLISFTIFFQQFCEKQLTAFKATSVSSSVK